MKKYIVYFSLSGEVKHQVLVVASSFPAAEANARQQLATTVPGITDKLKYLARVSEVNGQ